MEGFYRSLSDARLALHALRARADAPPVAAWNIVEVCVFYT
jgi:hypothetical protein